MSERLPFKYNGDDGPTILNFPKRLIKDTTRIEIALSIIDGGSSKMLAAALAMNIDQRLNQIFDKFAKMNSPANDDGPTAA